MGVYYMSSNNEQSLWNFDNVKNLNTLNEPKNQRKKKSNPFDVEQHKKVMESSPTPVQAKEKEVKKTVPDTGKTIKPVIIKNEPQSVKKVKNSDIEKNKEERIDINKFLKKQDSSSVVTEVKNAPAPTPMEQKVTPSVAKSTEKKEKQSTEFKASQEVKNALSNIRKNNERQKREVFDVVAYNEKTSQNSRSLIRAQMGQFSLIAQNTIPDALKGESWDKATQEQKNLAKKIFILISVLLVVIVAAVFIKASPDVKEKNVVAQSVNVPLETDNAKVSKNKNEENTTKVKLTNDSQVNKK